MECFVTKVESFVTKVGGDGGGRSGVLLRQERCAARWGAVCCRWRCSGNWGGGGERAKKRASRMAKGRRKGRKGEDGCAADGGCMAGWWVWKAFFMFYSIFSVFSRAFACSVGFSPYLCSATKITIVVIHTAGISVMMSIANSSAWTFFIYIRKVRHALG